MTADEAILSLAAARGAASSITPEDAARAMDAEDWRKRMGEIRGAAVRLAREGRIAILRKGKPVDPDSFKGVIRLRIVDGPEG
jgi:Protein of unknown function (DUF3253)